MTTILTRFSPSQRLSLRVVSTAVAMASAGAFLVTVVNLITAA